MNLVAILSEQLNCHQGPCGANVWSVGAPEMERASIFLNVASGILEIGSQEAEKSEKM